MNWLFIALLTATLSALANILMRSLAIKTVSPRAFSFVFNLWAVVFAGVIFLYQPKNYSFPSYVVIILIVLSSILYGIFERLQFFARKEIEASNITILFRVSPIITFIASFLIFHEIITINKVLGFALIIIATFLVTYQKGTEYISKKATLITLACAVALGLSRVVDKAVMNTSFSINFYNFILWASPLLFIYIPNIPLKEIKDELEIATWRIPLVALINVGVLYTQLYAFSLADASLVVPIISASTILIVLGGIFFLKEKENLLKKIVAAFIVFVGILLVS